MKEPKCSSQKNVHATHSPCIQYRLKKGIRRALQKLFTLRMSFTINILPVTFWYWNHFSRYQQCRNVGNCISKFFQNMQIHYHFLSQFCHSFAPHCPGAYLCLSLSYFSCKIPHRWMTWRPHTLAQLRKSQESQSKEPGDHPGCSSSSSSLKVSVPG